MTNEEKKLYLLDAYALIYRSYYAFINNPRITTTGINTSATFGFFNFLLELLELEKPTHLAVVFDPEGPTFRHEMYPPYKAQRPPMPEDLRKSVPYIKSIIEGLGIKSIVVSGFEADDVIGTLAKRGEKEGFQVYMTRRIKITPSWLANECSCINRDVPEISRSVGYSGSIGSFRDRAGGTGNRYSWFDG